MHNWLRKLYWDESEVTKGAFKSTTYFDHVSFLATSFSLLCSRNADYVLVTDQTGIYGGGETESCSCGTRLQRLAVGCEVECP